MKLGLIKIVGNWGGYIVLASVGLISLLLIFNVTVMAALKFIWAVLCFIGRFVKDIFTVQKKGEKDKAKPVAKPNFKLPNEVLPPPLDFDKEDKEEIVVTPPRMKVPPPPLPEFKLENDDAAKDADEDDAPFRSKSGGAYKLPSTDLLDDPTKAEKKREEAMLETTEARKQVLENVLRNFGVGASVVSASQGPAVTKFEIQPELGVKVSKIFNLADDIALNLATGGVRIEGPVSGKSVIGIEVPNLAVTPVRLKKIVQAVEFKRHQSKLFLGLGEDLSGTPIYGDLTKMPHLLIAGTTGSGKSVCINSIIISILLRARPDEVKMIMIDPKMVELSTYDGIPHLIAPVVTDAKKAAGTLKFWVLKEMERRYKEFHKEGARNLAAYNSKMEAAGQKERKIPLTVVIVDELADLMMVAANEVETSICRIAQMARATGIHLIIATQRPSVDVITGLIKANIPSRIAFAVATQIDSRVILDSNGAEKLLGRGDMLYNPIGAMKPTRLQGSFLSDKEIDRIVKHVKSQGKPDYVKEIIDLKMDDIKLEGEGGEGGGDGRDALFKEAVRIVLNGGNPSTSHLQRRLRVGYNRAARLMDELEAAGIVSAMEGENKARTVTANPEVLAKLGLNE
ncbi:MAG: DNA translocase FtsK [Candidatus Margulisbacteria bacterium]|nr:DNA translocase FtsK [Candidatus Margulisiibacteriota bacterium]MBU1022624.1 DNA translocase FtsK [Candidatus Margulisiibacteriota bacterium]MBU1729439.1 DNA translocase FtsK [Candidatus Margulisiibacteriota bacterium]MBU1955460.1 DNA translocase FtsK [Candidatus Margulisiibacteriota bacterium]